MAKIIVLGAMKGGVGKSVSTFNLAYSLAELGKKVLAVDFDSQANLTTCMGVEDVAAVPVTIGHLMMNQIEEEEQPNPEEYIISRNGVDFIPSSMVLSAVDAKLRIEMGAERILAGILLTMCEARTNLCKVITEQVSETFAGQIRIFKSKILNTVKVGESVYYSEPLLEYAQQRMNLRSGGR